MSAQISEEKSPAGQLCVRRKEGWQFYTNENRSLQRLSMTDDNNVGNINNMAPASGVAVYSPDGHWLAVVQSDHVALWNTRTRFLHGRIERANISAMHFSPLGNFLVTWESPAKDRNAAIANYMIWHCETLEARLGLHQREFSPNSMGFPLQWSSEEVICAHLMTHSISFFDGTLPRPLGENQSTRKLYLQGVSQFCMAASIESYRLATFVPCIKGGPASIRVWDFPKFEDGDAIYTKSIFQAERVELKFNASGSHLLMLCHTEVDATGEVYGGGTQLYFAACDGSISVQVPFKGDGQIQAAEWKVYEWSPDGRSFLTAVIHPFRRVDNGIRLWSYSGELLYNEAVPELYQASFRPALRGVYLDRPQSPKRKPVDSLVVGGSNNASVAAVVPMPIVASLKAYIPPHLRNNPNAVERMKANSLAGPVSSARRLNPQEQQAVRETILPAPVAPIAVVVHRAPVGMSQPIAQQLQLAGSAAGKVVKQRVVAASVVQAVHDEDIPKKIKAIQKKLRQVDQLKDDQMKGTEMDASQIEKLMSEDSLRQQLSQLILLDQ